MPYEIRPLTLEDLPAAYELSRLAFGAPREPPPEWLGPRPGRRSWGAYDGGGRLVARASDREQGQWFGGRLVPVSGVAGVAVAPEVRGTGLARQVMTALLAGARERGAVLSTLFRTTPGPYRRLGYEQVGTLTWTAVRTAELASLRVPAGVTLRPAGAADVPAVRDLYRRMARSGTGLMERDAPLFDTSAETVIGGRDGVSLALGADGTVEGYASWDRGPGYDAGGRVSVYDLVGHTAAATTALLAMLASWASVAPTLLLRLPDPDPALLLANVAAPTAESQDPWMLRVLDAPAAVAARGWPSPVAGTVDLDIEDEVCPWNAGPHRLELSSGAGRLTPGGSGSVHVTARGLAVLYAGAASPAILRRSGLLAGDRDGDALLQAATAGPAPALLDYF